MARECSNPTRKKKQEPFCCASNCRKPRSSQLSDIKNKTLFLFLSPQWNKSEFSLPFPDFTNLSDYLSGIFFKFLEMVRFSERETCKLVKLYRHHECLWNTDCDDYRNKRIKQAACEAIAHEMNIEGFSVSDVKNKLKSIKGTYNHEISKIRRFTEAGKFYQPNIKWFGIMESFFKKLKNQQPSGDNSSSENADHTTDGIFSEDSQWEQSQSHSEIPSASVTSMPSDSEIEESIRSISNTEVVTLTPEVQTLQSLSNSEVYTIIPEIQSAQPVSHSQVITVTPEILTVKAVSNPEPLPVTSGIKSVKSVSNPAVRTASPGVQTVKSSSNTKVFALIPEVQASKSVSNHNYVAISPGSKQNVRYAGGSHVISLAPETQPRAKQVSADETLGPLKRRHEEVSSTISNNEINQINKTRSVVADFSDRSEDEMCAFGHFVALNLRKMSMQSALSAQSEILSVLTRYRLNDSVANLPPNPIVPYILTNGSSSTQNPVLLQKVFLKS